MAASLHARPGRAGLLRADGSQPAVSAAELDTAIAPAGGLLDLRTRVPAADAFGALGFLMPAVYDRRAGIVTEGVFHPFVRTPVPDPLRGDRVAGCRS